MTLFRAGLTKLTNAVPIQLAEPNIKIFPRNFDNHSFVFFAEPALHGRRPQFLSFMGSAL